MNILDLLAKDGITAKRVSSTHGGEFASACPSCQGKDRFRSWPGQGDGGRWWCRGCGKGGDAIEYFKEFHGLSYIHACAELGIEPPKRENSSRSIWSKGHVSADSGKVWQKEDWTPKETIAPGVVWQRKAGSLVEWAEGQLWGNAGKDALLLDDQVFAV